MGESLFDEMKRYVGFGPEDGQALRALSPHAAPHFHRIAEEFYARLARHDEAHRILTGADQAERLKSTLVDWLGTLLSGPWDHAYYERRVRIGRVHVRIGLPQRYMLGAMNLVRIALALVTQEAFAGDVALRRRVVAALHKVLDLELTVQLESYREAFVDKVQELERQEAHDLATRTRRAERLASLGTMAAGLAHEIRNPLNAAQLQLTLLVRKLSRRESPDVVGALARADLRATAVAIVSLVRPEAAGAGVELALDPGSSVVADIDDERIKQVMLNLLRNAVEATGHGGHVRVAVSARGATAFLEVEDDGPGLPSPDAPIFEPFFTTKQGGTGLGLAIVHRIVSDHGGRVDVESRPGRTRFVASVPLPRR